MKVGWPAAALILAAALHGAVAAPARAQEEASALARAEAAADSGATDAARRLLARWRESEAGSADRAASARARLLAARLASDPDSARSLYVRLAVEGPPEIAARARLRLAQLRLAEGRPDRAMEDLERLRADFPGAPLAAESWLWTGRARHLAGDRAGACDAYRTAVRAAAGTGPGEEAEAALEGCASAVASGAGTVWSVQLGAFGDASAAEALQRQARRVGHPARVLPAGEDGLHRVRSGRWGSRADAEAAAGRLEAQGFHVLVVEVESTEEGSGGG